MYVKAGCDHGRTTWCGLVAPGDDEVAHFDDVESRGKCDAVSVVVLVVVNSERY